MSNGGLDHTTNASQASQQARIEGLETEVRRLQADLDYANDTIDRLRTSHATMRTRFDSIATIANMNNDVEDD